MNRRITYATQGTCSRFIDVELDEQGVIRDVVFTGGCHGNLQGISSLVKGQKAENVISRIEGIRCGNKSTSCPDQLAKALRKAME
ncbi:MAG: TIGR03905 family TSCPD domain-containing protein [Prevotella sp.]|nr:TIGR03905 family TSCPD domain-containing protein [Prevotella sp.]